MTCHIPVSHCPACHHPNDAATPLSGSDGVPVPGDYSVCAYCGAFLVFDEQLLRQLMTDEQIGDLTCDERTTMLHARAAVLAGKDNKDHEIRRAIMTLNPAKLKFLEQKVVEAGFECDVRTAPDGSVTLMRIACSDPDTLMAIIRKAEQDWVKENPNG